MPEILHVVAHIEAVSGHEATVREVLSGYCEPTRAEAGCIRYDLFEDLENPGKFTFIEEWESEAHLLAHSQSDHLNKGRALLEGKTVRPHWVQKLRQIR
jgi:quinol monooxygenase YgiN